ncbi:MmcQ/YjbR family DNA-binding protein [Methylobacterium sp. C25]|uniref:MmcQ/YjbR family DNA-binding protein n=1 Tax=Methylobacterium sp. C25 TaxID=2721622 RepID=UPI001F444765|nr:MmcQ/YjbR family DNA-binding protein [Methylobacterium sp. C25]MCE4225319.1 MmcQ/YjbR family DNA-binding protein [Methylobacterium sp. C25]
MSDDGVARLRKICLALPEATEKETFGGPTFRVREKIFAMPRKGDGRPSVWMKAPAHAQEILIGADPSRFFAPPYVGPKGWIGMRLDDSPDWSEVEALVTRSYRLIAPKRLAARVPQPTSGEG